MPQWCCDAVRNSAVTTLYVQGMLVSIECSTESRLGEHAFTDNLGCAAAGLEMAWNGDEVNEISCLMHSGSFKHPCAVLWHLLRRCFDMW